MKRWLLILLAGGALSASLRAESPAGAASPLTLADAEGIALRNHPRVIMARLQDLVAQEALKETRAAYFPTAEGYFDGVDVGDRDTRILAGELNNPTVYDRVADGLAVTQLITDFGRTSNLTASARLEAKAAGQASAATGQEILLGADLNFFGALQAQAVLRVARETVAARRLLVSQVSALAKNQLKSQLDVSFAQVALEESELMLQKAEGDEGGRQADLSAALGYRQARLFVLADVPLPPERPPAVETLVDTAMKNRPDLIRLRYERDAAGRYARAQRDQNYPTLDAVGTAGNAMSHDYRLPNKYAAGAIELDVPLFAGGSYLARQHEAELRAQAAEQALRDQEDDVARDVRLAWLNFNTALQRFRTTEQLRRHADEAFALARARYEVGSSSIVELTDAQVSATSAEIDEANARYDELIQQAVLDYQTGSLR